MDQVEYIKSNKGGIKIIYKDYMYTVHKNKKCGGIRWRCAQRSLNCKGSISTNRSGFPHINMPHNHLPDHHSIAIARHKFDDNLDGHLYSSIMAFSSKVGEKHSKNPDTVLVLNNMAGPGSKYDFCGMKKVRKSNFSPEEIDALIATVGKNYGILYGEFAKRAVNKLARHKVWLDVTKQVNKVSLERRTLQEVKNKWKKCQHLYKGQDSPDDIVLPLLPNVWEPLTPLKDSMPLEQRLKVPPDQEPILQSQPLSPTKLKVTRQSTKPPQSSPKPITPEPPNEEVCLRWNSHHSNMQTSFPNLLMREQYVDATLVAEGQSLKCHRLILSSCSPYFEEVLSGISPYQHPVLFMKDIPFWVLKSLCDFMYAGEVHIYQNKLEELLSVAETLKIKGLAGKIEGGAKEETKPTEPAKPAKEEKKEDNKEVKEKKRSSVPFESTPKTSSKTVKSVHPSKKLEKTGKESLNKEGILDPLDLLEPVYEEVTKEAAPPKIKEIKTVPVKKGKLKKRKISEEREESPPPMFLSRKGTRSRPNVKIPKYYHTHYERVTESTIVREPHTQQPDPLFQLVEEIKSEPLDLEDNVIEIEDNVVGFSELPTSHDEEIIGNYDSPLVNLKDKPGKEEVLVPFKKINLVSQPIIMNIHSVTEKAANTLQIVDLAQIKLSAEPLSKASDPLGAIPDPQGGKSTEDPLNIIDEAPQEATDGITITNVHSITDVDETQNKIVDDDMKEQEIEDGKDEKVADEANFETSVENVASELEDTSTIEEKSDETENVTPEPIQNEISADEKKEDDILSSEDVTNITKEKEEVTPPVDENKTATESLQNEISADDKKEDHKPSSEDVANIVEEENEVMRPAPENETVPNNDEAESEENVVELGFHIAKVASEQFSTVEGTNDALTEDRASDLGISSGLIEDSDPVTENNALVGTAGSDLGTFSNHLEQTEGNLDDSVEMKSALPVNSESLSEETQFLADSLEKLLDE